MYKLNMRLENVKYTQKIDDKMTDFKATSLVITCAWIIHTKEEGIGRMDKNYDQKSHPLT